MNIKSNKSGIIILSHGSRLKKANASLDKLVKEIKKKTGWGKILPAYLQFCQPDLSESVKGLVSAGCKKIIIMPFFLFNGNHVTKDIPSIIEEEKKKFPQVKFLYTKSLNQDARLADIVVDIIMEADSGNNY